MYMKLLGLAVQCAEGNMQSHTFYALLHRHLLLITVNYVSLLFCTFENIPQIIICVQI